MVLWGLGSSLLKMLAPAAASIPPTTNNITETISAASHRARNREST